MPLQPLPLLPGMMRALPRRPPAYQQPQPDESDLLELIGGGAASGLGMLGNFLDVPGSMARDVFAGANPFDQLLSPLTAANRTTGRQLLEGWGMRRNRETGIGGWLEDPGEGLRDIGGFAAEVLLDPLTYLTLGGASLSRAGQVAKRAGLLDDVNRLTPKGMGPRIGRQQSTLDDLFRVQPESNRTAARLAAENAARGMGEDLSGLSGQTLGKHFGLTLPFQDPFVTFNLGPLGRATSKGLDTAGAFLKKTRPVRGARMLFDPRVGNQSEAMAQEIAESAYRDRISSQATAKLANLEAGQTLDDLYQAFDTQVGDAVRPGAPEVDPRDLAPAIEEVFAEHRLGREINEPLRAFRASHRNYVQTARQNPTSDWASLNQQGRLPRFDEEWAENFGPGSPGEGLGIDSPDDLWDILRSGADPDMTRNSPEILQEATRRSQAAGAGQHPFTAGDVVRAGDRGNYGYVQNVGATHSDVFFRNPETGSVAVRRMPNEELTRSFAAGSGEAAGMGQQFTRQVADDILRATTELDDARRAFADIAPQIENPSQELLSKFESASQNLAGYRNHLHSDIESMGGKVRWLEEATEDSPRAKHFPRFVDQKTAKEATKGRILPASHSGMKGRTPETKGLPAHMRDQLLTNPRYRGEGAAERIAEDFAEHLDPHWGADPTAFDFESFSEPSVMEHAQALADYVHGKPQTRLTRGAFADQSQYMVKGHAVERSLASIHEVFHRHGEEGLEGGATLADAFRRAGLNPETATRKFAERFNLTEDQVRRFRVPEEAVNGAKSVVQYFDKGPQWQGKIGETIDTLNAWFKQNVTVLFPAFLSRNFTSGQHLNLVSGLANTPADLAAYGREFKDSLGVLKRAREAFASGEPLGAADEQILRELYAYSIVNPKQLFEGVDVAPQAVSANPLEGILPPSPLAGGQSAGRARDFVANNPLGFDQLPGAMKARRGYRTLIETGTAANQMVEWQNRVPLFMYLRKKGYSAEQAAREVTARHFDYGDLTEFERGVAKRAIPFYTFSRKVAPFVSRQLTQRPGGGIGQTIRATRLGTGGEGEILPQHVRETTAIPLGEADDGTLRFLTGLGLAHEDPLSFLGGDPSVGGLLQSAGMEAVSRSNPLFKGPLEWFTGESFFQRGPMGGRDLSDMDPTVGRLLTNLGLQDEDPVSGRARDFVGPLTEHALVNSPATRLLNTARTLTDERKWENPTVFPGDALLTNLLTGMRTTDVSPAAQDAVVRDMVAPIVMDELGGRDYTNRYIPKATIAEARERGDDEIAERMEAFNRLNRLLASRTRDRKKP